MDGATELSSLAGEERFGDAEDDENQGEGRKASPEPIADAPVLACIVDNEGDGNQQERCANGGKDPVSHKTGGASVEEGDVENDDWQLWKDAY